MSLRSTLNWLVIHCVSLIFLPLFWLAFVKRKISININNYCTISFANSLNGVYTSAQISQFKGSNNSM